MEAGTDGQLAEGFDPCVQSWPHLAWLLRSLSLCDFRQCPEQPSLLPGLCFGKVKSCQNSFSGIEGEAHMHWMIRVPFPGRSGCISLCCSGLSFPVHSAEGSLMNSSSYSRKSSTVKNRGGFSVTPSSDEIPTLFVRCVAPPCLSCLVGFSLFLDQFLVSNLLPVSDCI